MRSGRITLSSGELCRWRNAPWAALWIVGGLLGAPAPAAALEATVYVTLDRAQVMPYPADTETIVVGNPIIADVTMLKNSRQIILTGRGYGETNLVFLDHTGNVLSEAKLRVRESQQLVVVQRGLDRETYACQTRCQPTVNLGDAHDYLQANVKDIQTRNGLASGAASGPAAPQGR